MEKFRGMILATIFIVAFIGQIQANHCRNDMHDGIKKCFQEKKKCAGDDKPDCKSTFKAEYKKVKEAFHNCTATHLKF